MTTTQNLVPVSSLSYGTLVRFPGLAVTYKVGGPCALFPGKVGLLIASKSPTHRGGGKRVDGATLVEAL